MRIKGVALLIVIVCMGTALDRAISGQDNAPAEMLGAAAKKQYSASQPDADHDQTLTAMRFDLSAIKRTVPEKIRASSLFKSKSWYMPPPQPPAIPVLPPSEPQPPSVSLVSPQPPSAPPLPFTFIGRAIDGNDVTLFLTNNNQQYSAKLNDVLDNNYRVDKITEKSAVLTYLPMNIQQDLIFNSTSIGISALSASASVTTMQPPAQPLQ